MSQRSAAQEALWGGLRVVVIDLETTASPGGGTDRALQFAAVTCLGHTDIDALLEEVSGGATTRTVKGRAHTGSRERPEAPLLPVEHLEGHTLVLSRRAGVRLFAKWHAQAPECARLRCRHLTDLVAAAQAPGDKVLAELRSLIDELAGAGDTAGAATVMGATVQFFDHRPGAGWASAKAPCGGPPGPPTASTPASSGLAPPSATRASTTRTVTPYPCGATTPRALAGSRTRGSRGHDAPEAFCMPRTRAG
jgi:hypothetical protein